MPHPCCSLAMPFVNSHMPCHAPLLLQQCRVLRENPRGSRKYPNCWSNSLTDHLFSSVLLPLFTVVGMDRCEEDWYASDNNLHGTRVVVGRSWTRAGNPQAVSRRPCCAVALRRMAWSEQGKGVAWQVWTRHGCTV